MLGQLLGFPPKITLHISLVRPAQTDLDRLILQSRAELPAIRQAYGCGLADFEVQPGFQHRSAPGDWGASNGKRRSPDKGQAARRCGVNKGMVPANVPRAVIVATSGAEHLCVEGQYAQLYNRPRGAAYLTAVATFHLKPNGRS